MGRRDVKGFPALSLFVHRDCTTMFRMNVLKLREMVFDKLEGAYRGHYKSNYGQD